jgi:hypothetical protein
MIRKLFLIIIVNLLSIQFANALNIQQIIVSSVNTQDINIYVKVQEGFTFGYYNHSYTISGNIITLTVCYYPSLGSSFTVRENNFIIPNINLIQNNFQLIVNTWYIQSDGVNIVCSNQNPLPDTQTMFFSTPLTVPILLGINENEVQWNEFIFNNPSDGQFQFETKDELTYLITFYDSSGKSVKSVKLKSREILDLTELQNGIYYVNFKHEERQITKRLILNKS